MNTTKDFRNFGLTIGIILAIFGVVGFINTKSQAINYLLISLFLLIPALVYPTVLKLPYILWMKLGDILGFIMTRVILAILFYLVLTPTTLVLRIVKKDLLNLKFEPKKSSYWLKKDKLDKSSLLKQY
jgi:multisubunit Na+/H+ antiporter MnhG subunit